MTAQPHHASLTDLRALIERARGIDWRNAHTPNSPAAEQMWRWWLDYWRSPVVGNPIVSGYIAPRLRGLPLLNGPVWLAGVLAHHHEPRLMATTWQWLGMYAEQQDHTATLSWCVRLQLEGWTVYRLEAWNYTQRVYLRVHPQHAGSWAHRHPHWKPMTPQGRKQLAAKLQSYVRDRQQDEVARVLQGGCRSWDLRHFVGGEPTLRALCLFWNTATSSTTPQGTP